MNSFLNWRKAKTRASGDFPEADLSKDSFSTDGIKSKLDFNTLNLKKGTAIYKQTAFLKMAGSILSSNSEYLEFLRNFLQLLGIRYCAQTGFVQRLPYIFGEACIKVLDARVEILCYKYIICM